MGTVEEPSPGALVICGPSGVGKGTLINRLIKEFPERFSFCCSHTTRKPREGEKEGDHYHFVDRDTMERDIADGKFLEYAAVNDKLYGTSFKAVRTIMGKGKACILDIDVQGAQLVSQSELAFQCVYVFILPPSIDVLEARLKGRKTESEDEIMKRMATAKTELAFMEESDLFDNRIVNEDLEKAYEAFREVAMKAYRGERGALGARGGNDSSHTLQFYAS